ncbi:MAG: hypothetical protein BMS9Abin11_1044 [Gammaproteobacteria bacterium]|nr:MAG: hypothetical protein BMS9Abin11_1044 [Gammaproteobacteria bacterium]
MNEPVSPGKLLYSGLAIASLIRRGCLLFCNRLFSVQLEPNVLLKR